MSWKEVLGLCLAQTEGASSWLQVVTKLRNRGVQNIFIAHFDGVKWFPEAIEALFPHNHGLAVDRAHAPAQPEPCLVQATAGSGGRPQAHLYLRHCRRGRVAGDRVLGVKGSEQGAPSVPSCPTPVGVVRHA